MAKKMTNEERLAERKRVDDFMNRKLTERSAARKTASPRTAKPAPKKKQLSPEKTQLGRAVMSAAPTGVRSGLQSLQDALNPQKKKKKKK